MDAQNSHRDTSAARLQAALRRINYP